MSTLTKKRMESLKTDIALKSPDEALKFLKSLYVSPICSEQRSVLIKYCEERIPSVKLEESLVVPSGFD